MSKRVFWVTVLSMIMMVMGTTCLNAQDATPTTSTQKAAIKIDEIIKDEAIKGKVANLESPQQYKVLVYVHTDKWYIHPYAGSEEGKSWAAIKENGEWTLPTVKRDVKANKIAALVVELAVAEDAPPILENVEEIKNHVMIIYTKDEMKEKDWYGKL
jgi:hypothetical protein